MELLRGLLDKWSWREVWAEAMNLGVDGLHLVFKALRPEEIVQIVTEKKTKEQMLSVQL